MSEKRGGRDPLDRLGSDFDELSREAEDMLQEGWEELSRPRARGSVDAESSARASNAVQGIRDDARSAGQYWGQASGEGLHGGGATQVSEGRDKVDKLKGIRKKYHDLGQQAAADGRIKQRYPKVENRITNHGDRVGEGLIWDAFRSGFTGQPLAEQDQEGQAAVDTLRPIADQSRRRR